ncbi:hypothetical protein V7112_13660 [Bacillus sp. JJ1566]|uniref:hypothetical protein n=1 Tax=Bacillus sp. JJ1566 TaxID=3122961 RepID=UPI003000CC83
MKKVILFDAFSFVGYGLCCRMIDQEVQVVGVDAKPRDNSSEEDKMLRIGRNAFFEFIEYPKAMVDQSIFLQTDAVIYPWINPNSTERIEEKEVKLQSVLEYCNVTKTKLILVSAHSIERNTNCNLEDELDDSWYSKINIKNSLNEHQKVRTKNIEFLFTFIDFSIKELGEAINIKNDHEEWISQNFYA